MFIGHNNVLWISLQLLFKKILILRRIHPDINVPIYSYDGRCICEKKSRIAKAKAAFNKKRALFTSTLDLKLRKKLVKCYIWSVAL
jgi:hypothetical protein